MQLIDDAEFQIAIDDDNGARITSLKWRENEFAVPFRGQVHTSGWYAMAPWAGRIKEALIQIARASRFNYQQLLIHHMRCMVLGLFHRGTKLVLDVRYCICHLLMATQLWNNRLKS